MTSKKQLGKFGEQIAADYLRNNDYRIIATNYYTRAGEIDIICEKEKVTIFVEIKTRSTQNFGWPEEAVNPSKLSHLIAAIQLYFLDQSEITEWHIDVISIIINFANSKAKLWHFSNFNTDS